MINSIDLSLLKTEISEFENELKPWKFLHDRLKEIAGHVHEIGLGSSNMWFKGFNRLYYKNFEEPPLHAIISTEWGRMRPIPDGWFEYTYDEILGIAEAEKGDWPLSKIEKTTDAWIELAERLQSTVGIELGILRSDSTFVNEYELLDKIEKFKFGISAQSALDAYKPNTLSTRDADLIQAGVVAPLHVHLLTVLLSQISRGNALVNFIDVLRRLVRQIEIRKDISLTLQSSDGNLEYVLVICRRFHRVAKRLERQTGAGSSFIISDERDMQMLFHALLRIHYDDIRTEDYVPIYAGGASRADFLLKKEHAIVECKITRKNRTEKEIGSELLIDIAKYQQHPECRHLVCFVYDPQGHIENPAGLETDLVSQSREGIQVIPIVVSSTTA